MKRARTAVLAETFARRSFIDIAARSIAAGCVGRYILSTAALSQDAGEPPAGKAANLFQSDSLDGWKPTDFFRPGEVTIREGVVTLGKGSPMTGVTYARKSLAFRNFELSYEARRTDGDDFFAAATFPVDGGHLTFVNGGWSGNVTGLSSIDGADASENETATRFEFENGRWYRFVIHVKGRKVNVTIDGKQVVDFDGTDRSLRTRVESRPSEPLGFASFGCTGQIRAARIKEIGD